MKNAIVDKWNSLSKKQQRALVLLSAAGILALVATGLMQEKSENRERRKAAQQGPRQIRLDPQLLQDSAATETLKKAQQAEERAAALEKRFDQLEERLLEALQSRSAPGLAGGAGEDMPFDGSLPPPPAPIGENGSSPSNGSMTFRNAPAPALPPPPAPKTAAAETTDTAVLPPPELPPPLAAPPSVPSASGPGGAEGTPAATPAPQVVKVVGAIASFENPQAQGASARNASAKENDTKKNGSGNDRNRVTEVYLPPSILPAKLLTGLDASTSSGGSGEPEPMLLRVQAPAILPNALRAQLRGCFVLAEGVGRLDKERINVRLLSLHCLNKSGRAVIDSPIKGYVADADGKSGLAGHVVSRMGSAAARAMLAGMIQGAGQALQTSAQSQNVTALGTTQVVDPDQVARSAFGGAIAQGVSPVVDLYVNLAKQATPVIEKNPGADVTCIITEGTTLKIQWFDSSAAY